MFMHSIILTASLLISGIKLNDLNLFHTPLCEEADICHCHKHKLILRSLDKKSCKYINLNKIHAISRMTDITRSSICNYNNVDKNISIENTQLLERVIGNNNITASSYYDRATAEEAIRSALFLDSNKIYTWLIDGNSKNILKMTYLANKNIGYGVKLNSNKIIDMNGITITLKKEKSCEFSILSSYPIYVPKGAKQ